MAHYYSAYLNLLDITKELYNSILDSYYSKAVKISAKLDENNNGSIITDVVSRLAQENNPNLLSFCHQLWNLGQKEIVNQRFPSAYQAIFNENYVTVTGKKFELALKLVLREDYDGDREAFADYVDKTSSRVKWQVLPFWMNNKVYFKMKNFDYGMFLKMGFWPDNISDREVFGTKNADEDRQYWELEPMALDGKHYFYIMNKQFSLGLKLAESTDYDGDRKLWGHNGNIKEDPHRFAWTIEKHESDHNEEL